MVITAYALQRPHENQGILVPRATRYHLPLHVRTLGTRKDSSRQGSQSQVSLTSFVWETFNFHLR